MVLITTNILLSSSNSIYNRSQFRSSRDYVAPGIITNFAESHNATAHRRLRTADDSTAQYVRYRYRYIVHCTMYSTVTELTSETAFMCTTCMLL